VKRAVLAACAACVVAACGRKGPPLPPLVKLPVAPTELAASRRGSTVDLSFTVPASNTDGTKPANISRVDVYALTAPVSTSDTVVLADGARVATVQVKTPRDPNDTVDVDEPASDVEPPQGPGLDQGATGHAQEVLTAAAMARPAASAREQKAPIEDRPLVGPPLTAPTRLYLTMGVSPRGRRGPVSKRVMVPLIEPPPPGPRPDVTFDQSGITVTWPAGAASEEADEGLLPSRSLVSTAVTTAYNVYETPAAGGTEVKLTSAPSTDPRFVDDRVEWGRERCYAVRLVSLVDGMAVEGERGEPACVTPVDTFPPAQPKKPTAIARPGAINILWDASEEPDLAGYLVFRGTEPGGEMTQLTPEPIDRTSYTDEVAPNFRAFYAIAAVDTAGNRSPRSPVSDEETAR
jgi:hypothetical protein